MDVFSSEKLGRRRMWIVGAQAMMVLTLLATVGVALVVTLIAGVVAVSQRNQARDESARADDQARVATVRELSAASAATRSSDWCSVL